MRVERSVSRRMSVGSVGFCGVVVPVVLLLGVLVNRVWCSCAE
jgi:hypothetical protein